MGGKSCFITSGAFEHGLQCIVPVCICEQYLCVHGYSVCVYMCVSLCTCVQYLCVHVYYTCVYMCTSIYILIYSLSFAIYVKGLQRQRLIGSAVAGFNNARTITKASAGFRHKTRCLKQRNMLPWELSQ